MWMWMHGNMHNLEGLLSSNGGRARPITDRANRPRAAKGTESESLGTAKPEKPPRAGDRLAWTVTRRSSPIKAWRRNRPGAVGLPKGAPEKQNKKEAWRNS
jgi:hypothetical protein